MFLIILWTVIFLVVVTKYFNQSFTRFSKAGVKHLKPVPVFGNMWKMIFKVDHFSEDITTLYNAFPGERFVGRYDFGSPVIVVRDTELVKKITVKDFEHFQDHKINIDTKIDPLFGHNLIAMKGQEWKDMRSTLSPAFTSSKIRNMVPFMVEVADQMITLLKNKFKESGEKYIDVDVKDLATRCTNDVVASCAFGLKVNSHIDRTNRFYLEGKQVSNFTFKQVIRISLSRLFPKLIKFTRFPDTTQDFFRTLVLGTMQDREVKKIIRPDMIHLLMEARRGKLTHDEKKDEDAGFATVTEDTDLGKKVVKRDWSDDHLVAQAILFLIAGYETVSTGMSFTLLELARNPEVQKKLVQEIKENHDRTGGKFDYTTIQNLRYLDMVISEALRFWPSAMFLDRVCNKDYNLGKPNDKASQDFIVRKGEAILVPVLPIHHDPQHYPDPEKFDPERFSEENRHNITSSIYMPFGVGPRNCIGSRFALCEIKVIIYYLLLHLDISISDKLVLPIKIDKKSFNLSLKGGHWLRFHLRE